MANFTEIQAEIHRRIQPFVSSRMQGLIMGQIREVLRKSNVGMEPSQPAAPADDTSFVGRWSAAIKSLPMDGSSPSTAARKTYSGIMAEELGYKPDYAAPSTAAQGATLTDSKPTAWEEGVAAELWNVADKCGFDTFRATVVGFLRATAQAAAPTPVADSGASQDTVTRENAQKWAASAGIMALTEGWLERLADFAIFARRDVLAAAKPVSVDAGGMTTLRNLRDVLRMRHHGRMPEDVQRAYDEACAVLDTPPTESTGSTGEPK